MRFIPNNLKGYNHVNEHNWLIHQIMINYLKEVAQKHAHGTVVDIGCGSKPYKSLFSKYADKYIGFDLIKSTQSNNQADVIAAAYDTPLRECTVDTILSSEVLEHLEEPKKAVGEMNRILKKGGIVILTVPFFWHIHEAPRDFYRYSEFGLRYIFESSGFEIVEIKPLTGFIVTFSQLLVYYLRRFQRGLLLRSVGRLLNWAIQLTSYWLNKYDRSSEFTNLYGVVARKVN